jgi:uncharacterized protein DUF5658
MAAAEARMVTSSFLPFILAMAIGSANPSDHRIHIFPGAPIVSAPLSRGSLLPTLYVSFTGLNVFDAYSTTAGLRRGARETNPVMRAMAGNPAIVWTVKSAVTASSIAVSERLWRTGRRREALAVMIISNGIMAAVAARNAAVLQGLR